METFVWVCLYFASELHFCRNWQSDFFNHGFIWQISICKTSLKKTLGKVARIKILKLVFPQRYLRGSIGQFFTLGGFLEAKSWVKLISFKIWRVKNGTNCWHIYLSSKFKPIFLHCDQMSYFHQAHIWYFSENKTRFCFSLHATDTW